MDNTQLHQSIDDKYTHLGENPSTYLKGLDFKPFRTKMVTDACCKAQGKKNVNKHVRNQYKPPSEIK